MNWKRSLCAGLTAALLAGALAGCAAQPAQPTPQNTPAADDIAYQAAAIPRDTVLFTADGAEVTADDYFYWLLNAIAMAKNSGYLADDAAWEEEIDGTPTAEYLKRSALENSKLYAVALEKAEGEGMALTQEEQDEIDAQLDALASTLETYYGVTFQEYLDQQCISGTAYRRMAYEVPLLVGDLQESYTQAGEFDPTDEAMADMIQREGIYSCKHILLAFPENEDGSAATDEQKAAVKAEADALLADLQAADDPVAAFETAMNEKSQDGRDPETNQLYKPEGYTFLADGVLVDGSSALVAPFAQAGAALAEGELSQPVETDYGYHILLGQSADNEETRSLYPNYAMNRRIDQWMADAEVETTAAYEALDPKAFYDGMMELARQWQEEAQAQASPAPEESVQPSADPGA